MKRWLILLAPLLAAIVAALLWARTDSGAETGSDGHRGGGERVVVTTIAPLGALAAELVADDVTIRVLVPPGSSPHHLALKPSDRAALESAALVVAVGPGLDGWLPLPEERTWWALEHLDERALRPQRDHAVHDHDHDHDHHHHAHGEYDPHVWTDPLLASMLVRDLHAALAAAGLAGDRDPGELARELTVLDRDVRAHLTDLEGRQVVQHHPSFSYFLFRYGLRELGAVATAAAEDTGPRHLQDLLAAAGADPEQVVVIHEPQLDRRSIHPFIEAGCQVVTLDPLGAEVRRGGYRDWLLDVAERLRSATTSGPL